MNPFPLSQKLVSALGHLTEQAAHIGPLDADAGDHLRHAGGAEQIDFRLSRPGYVDVRRFMIECVNDEPEAVGAMNDNHHST
jgi:hypothetical protein